MDSVISDHLGSIDYDLWLHGFMVMCHALVQTWHARNVSILVRTKKWTGKRAFDAVLNKSFFFRKRRIMLIMAKCGPTSNFNKNLLCQISRFKQTTDFPYLFGVTGSLMWSNHLLEFRIDVYMYHLMLQSLIFSCKWSLHVCRI